MPEVGSSVSASPKRSHPDPVSSHILDTSLGMPARGVKVTMYAMGGQTVWTKLQSRYRPQTTFSNCSKLYPLLPESPMMMDELPTSLAGMISSPGLTRCILPRDSTSRRRTLKLSTLSQRWDGKQLEEIIV